MSTSTILTPDQRLRVFVSSTLGELAPERSAVRAAVESLRLAPVMFELGARPHPPRALYRSYLEQSHVFLGVYWERYGWVAPGMDFSGLEDEYRLSGGHPRLMYVKEPASAREERLAGMLEQMRRAGDRLRVFSDADDLGAQVATDLAGLLAERFQGHVLRRSLAWDAGDLQPEAGPVRLPAPATDLIGRERELAEVIAMIRRPGMRLITLTGMGGIGKSRLAIAAAEAMADDFPGGRVFVPLAEVPEASFVMRAIADTLGVKLEGSRSAVDSVAEVISGPRRFLLVLDNAEHVIDAARDVSALLRACANLVVVVTSRRRLLLSGELDFAVPTLRLASAEGEVPPALALFLDRAAAANTAIDPTDPVEGPAVRELVERLEGLPLALELAAARVRVLGSTGLLARLSNPLELPAARLADLPERQRTLRATLDWSYSMLPAPASDLLNQLSTFVGSASLSAVERVCVLCEDKPAAELDDADTLEALATLVDHSLLTVDGAAPDAPRFRMLETVREYARERLEAEGGRERLDRRHREWILDLAAEASIGLAGPSQVEWLERLEAEAANLRAAVARAQADGDAAALALIASRLWVFYWLSHRAQESRAWAEPALADATDLDPELRGLGWWTLCAGAFEEGDDEQAAAWLERSAPLLKGSLEGRTLTAFMSACLAPARDDLEGGEVEFAVAAEGFAAMDQPFLQAVCLVTRSMQLAGMGRTEESAESMANGLVIAERIDNPYLAALMADFRGFQRLLVGDVAQARDALAEAVAYASAARNAEVLAYSAEGVAACALLGGDALRAARLLGGASGLRERSGFSAWPLMRSYSALMVEGVRGALGDDFDTAWESGRDWDFGTLARELSQALAADPEGAAGQTGPAVALGAVSSGPSD